MPTITQFEIFVKVIDEGSFTKAAQALHMSEVPAVSHAISALIIRVWSYFISARAWERFEGRGNGFNSK